MSMLVEERASTKHLQQPGALTHYSYRVAYTDDDVADKASAILGVLLVCTSVITPALSLGWELALYKSPRDWLGSYRVNT